MYRIPEMPRPGLAFAQSFIQGLQLGSTMRQAREQKEERDEERRQKAITNMMNLAQKTGNFDLINKLGRAGFPDVWVDIEQPSVTIGAEPAKTEKETIPAEMPGVPEIDQETVIPGKPGKKLPVSRTFQQKWQEMKAVREQYGPEAAQKYLGALPPTQKESAIMEKFSLLAQLGTPVEGIIKAFGGWIEDKKPQIVETGVEGKPDYAQKVLFDFEKGEVTKKVGSPYRRRAKPMGAAETVRDKLLTRIASDYFETRRQLNMALRGAEVYMPEAFREPRERVINESRETMTNLAEQYKNLGGDVADLGIIEETPLPEGITEEDVEYTMEQEGLSREEVIKRYLELKKKK